MKTRHLSLRSCTSCQGFVPVVAARCPHCSTIQSKRALTRIGAIGVALGASAFSFTLMACYGCPDGSCGVLVNADACADSAARSDAHASDAHANDAATDSSVIGDSDAGDLDAESDGDAGAVGDAAPDADGGI